MYLTDRQGIPLTMSEPISGNHNDLFDIEVHFEEITAILEGADISVDGLFLSADAGFNSQKFRDKCEDKEIIANFAENKRNGNSENDYYFDEKLYKERYSIKRINVWVDAFRSLLNRFETSISSCKRSNYLSFMVIALRKLLGKEKVK